MEEWEVALIVYSRSRGPHELVTRRPRTRHGPLCITSAVNHGSFQKISEGNLISDIFLAHETRPRASFVWQTALPYRTSRGPLVTRKMTVPPDLKTSLKET